MARHFSNCNPSFSTSVASNTSLSCRDVASRYGWWQLAGSLPSQLCQKVEGNGARWVRIATCSRVKTHSMNFFWLLSGSKGSMSPCGGWSHLLTISSYEENYLSDPAWEVCIWSLSKFIDKEAHIDKGQQEPEIWHCTVGVSKSDCTKQSKTMRIVSWERNITWWQHYAQPKFPRLIKLSLQTSNISNLIATTAFLL